MPVTIIEGIRTQAHGPIEGAEAERRFRALTLAIKDHEARRHEGIASSPERDAQLYARMRQLCGDADTADRGVA